MASDNGLLCPLFSCWVMFIIQAMIGITDNFVCSPEHNNGPLDYLTNVHDLSSIVLGFLNPMSQPRCTDLTTFCMQLRNQLKGNDIGEREGTLV